MTAISQMTRLRLNGKVDALDFIPDEFEDEPQEKDPLLSAIELLTEEIKRLQLQAPSVDMEPIVRGIQSLQNQPPRKKKWKFSVVRNGDGDIQDIVATEL